MTRTRNVGIVAALSVFCFGCVGDMAQEARAPQEHIVTAVSDIDEMRMYFEPRRLEIAVGDTVTWVNEEAIEHNMMSYPDGYPEGGEGFESPFLEKAGETWSHTFDQAGVYEYHCLPHMIMGMRGTVFVGDTPEEATRRKPSRDQVWAYRERLLEYFAQEDIDAFPRASQVFTKTSN